LNKIILTKKTSAIFLVIVLVTGTITLMHPSFMAGAQAQPYYGQDNNYDKKSDKKDVSVKSIKCNNINVNVNGLELDVLPPFLTGLASEAQTTDEGQTGASSYGNGKTSYGDGGQSGSDGDFKFICINNNNNTVVVGEEPPTPPVEECAEADEIEACFANAEFMGEVQFPEFVAALEAGITVEINGQDITLRSFNDICLAFEGLTTYQQLRDAVNEIGIATGATFGEGFLAVVDCIAEALDIPIPPR
jgi:hypothetical protein